MAPRDSGLTGDAFDTGFCAFLTVPVLRVALADWVAFLPFAFFLAIEPPPDHLTHRREGAVGRERHE